MKKSAHGFQERHRITAGRAAEQRSPPAELKVSERTLARWQDQADGLPVTRIGGRTLFRVDSVKAWLKAHERRPNPRRAA